MSLKIPKSIHPAFTFRQFVEFVGDNSVFFATHSGIAKLTMLLSAIARAKRGIAEPDGDALALLKTALNAEGQQALPLRLAISGTHKDTGEPLMIPVAPRALLPYLDAIMEAK